ncbi:MAG: type II toxin-antitoxin system VapC family toxin [Gammaproteobacteria bacterium]|nr:type II toxin-antitoxin system VapC family toxin [Gammaproteobacteria bacterium]
MILVDTSVWVDHLRRGEPALVDALENGEVAVHPFVVGELACGNLPDRALVFRLLEELPAVPVASNPEVLALIERRRLMGKGLGFVDAHLLASTLLVTGEAMRLWTRDGSLGNVALQLGIAHRAGRTNLQ